MSALAQRSRLAQLLVLPSIAAATAFVRMGNVHVLTAFRDHIARSIPVRESPAGLLGSAFILMGRVCARTVTPATLVRPRQAQ